jgi:hypothetical protein
VSVRILAIDPGPTESAWCLYAPPHPPTWAKWTNDELLERLQTAEPPFNVRITHTVIEAVASYGMAVGKDVFETVFWTGRFYETIRRTEGTEGIDPHRMFRMAVKMHLCHSAKAKDSNIRQALIDRLGPGKDKAIGVKKTPGPLFGFAKDGWAALALAVTFADTVAAPVPVDWYGWRQPSEAAR